MPKRIYSEKEVAQLIRRAVELEANRSVSGESNTRAGLSITELEKIAAESGIDPELMLQAARELDEKPASKETEEINKVSKTEIVSERWIKARPNDRTMDDLIMELNHKFGTSEDDINWWDQLWDNYAGKAKIKKTSRSVEWRYTDEMEMYTTRVLMQQRGEKFRIRVSKRQGWNLSWYSDGSHIFLAVMVISISIILGGVLGFALFDSPFLGIFFGLLLSIIIVPASIAFSKHQLNKHKNEVTEIADHLAQQATQLIDESPFQQSNHKKNKQTDLKTIEIDIKENDDSSTDSNHLRNNLRE